MDNQAEKNGQQTYDPQALMEMILGTRINGKGLEHFFGDHTEAYTMVLGHLLSKGLPVDRQHVEAAALELAAPGGPVIPQDGAAATGAPEKKGCGCGCNGKKGTCKSKQQLFVKLGTTWALLLTLSIIWLLYQNRYQ